MSIKTSAENFIDSFTNTWFLYITLVLSFCIIEFFWVSLFVDEDLG